jgi:hypothetical protein
VNFLKKYFSNFLKNEVESKFTHDAGEFEWKSQVYTATR